jgi:hypothetical protein
MSKSTKHIVAILVLISAMIYAIQFLFFHDIRDTFFYMLQDWAFLPIQIALVSVLLGKIINDREKQERLDKTRILTSTFFSELGTKLLETLEPRVRNADEIRPVIKIDEKWQDKDFFAASEAIKNINLTLKLSWKDFAGLRDLLSDKRMTLLIIASNPALLDHEQFTDMLWAIFHLNDELATRKNLEQLSESDLAHLNDDASRVLSATLVNWICHIEFLKKEYPYLYLLEVYRNPFGNDAEIAD